MLKNGRPYHLPQVYAPYDAILEKLENEGIDYEILNIQPNENDGINPSQPYVFSDEMENCNIDEMFPIWLADENNALKICDGHHRYFKAMLDNMPIIAINIKLPFIDACRVLNKIQDIYEYEQMRGLEEVEMQDAINYYQGDDEQFLTSLEEDNTAIQVDKPGVNQQKLIAYRKEPIKENSTVGNFFVLNPMEGFDKYEIEFDNLLDTDALGVMYKDSQEPVDILAKIWFPHVNFEEISKQYNTPSINLKGKAVAEKATKMGFDGIKYGDKLIQGLK